MTQVLSFADEAQVLPDGRRVRSARFVPQSNFPLSTACVVANAVRERFAAKLGCAHLVDLFEPVPVTTQLMDRLLPGASVFMLDAPAGRFWLMLGAKSIVALVSAAFGESQVREAGALSALEQQAFHTMVGELAALCAPLYGEVRSLSLTHDYAPIYRAASYFEIRFSLATPIYIGILLARDPNELCEPTIDAQTLAHVPLSARGIAGTCEITLAELGALEIGQVLPMIRRESAQLITGKVILAHGTCGIANGRNAFLVGQTGESSKS